MDTRDYTGEIAGLKRLIMRPIYFQNVCVTLLDCLPARHDGDWIHEDHRHPWFEFNYVADGAVYTVLEGHSFRIEAGQSYMIPPGAVHSHHHADHLGDDGFCLRWQLEEVPSPSGMEDGSSCAAMLTAALSAVRASPIDGQITRLLAAADADRPLSVMQADYAAWLLSMCAAWMPIDNRDREQLPNQSADELLVRQTILYLEEYYASRISVHDIAKSLNISYRHLARVFKRRMELTIVEKLNDIRIRHAKRFLCETAYSMREIAARVGFENEYYFSNTFHRYTVSTPSDYRRRVKNSLLE